MNFNLKIMCNLEKCTQEVIIEHIEMIKFNDILQSNVTEL